MTSLVGILCSDGVVIGADSAATSSNGQAAIVELPTRKIDVIGDQLIVVGTGDVGLGQRFVRAVGALYNAGPKPFVDRDPWTIAKDICLAGISDFQETAVKPGNYGALVAFPAHKNRDLCLFEFAVKDFQPEMKDDRIWYASMGCAQFITDPFLSFIREVFWDQGQPSLSEGVFAATWTLDQAISCNPGGVDGPIRLATLSRDKGGHATAAILDDDELLEHKQNIAEAVSTLRAFRSAQSIDAATPTPPVLGARSG